MWERFNKWSPKIKVNKWWVIGAIATPVLFWMVWWLWLPPHRRPQTDHSPLSNNKEVTLTHQDGEPLISGMGAIAVVGGVLLLLSVRNSNRNTEATNLSGADLNYAEFSGVDLSSTNLNGAEFNSANLSDANLSDADLSGADLNYADLYGANLSGANLNGADLISANLSGVNLSGADLRYANLSGTNLRYANLSGADLRYANLSGADLNCALLSDANLSDTNLSGALLFFINLREVLNLEPLQLEAKPSPFLCNVALPVYSRQPEVNPNRACDLIPQLLSDRYDISLQEAQGIVNEARQHRWN